jgi:NAD(P)-dependent dehydrogenase (short-subunit alcohol dehydrogenase family)
MGPAAQDAPQLGAGYLQENIHQGVAEMSYFAGKIAVITGAGSGIGRALALQLAAQGSHLALSDVNEAGLAETVELLPKHAGLRIASQRLDVADRAAFAHYAKQIVDMLGRVDVVINNAGVASRPLMLDQYDYAEYERVINVNLWGVIHGSHEFLPHLLANPGSHLVNISSIFGLVAPPETGAYCLTKFAVRGYTEALRADLAGRDIHVHCVHPGVIATNIAAAAGASDDVVKLFSERGMTADKAAAIILKGVAKHKPRILVTAGARVLDLLQRLTPAHYTRLVLPLMRAPSDAG